MTAQHQSSSTSNAEKNTENKISQCFESECINSGMVAVERLSEEPNKEEIRIEEWSETEDANSTSSKDHDNDEDCQSEVGQEIITPNECVGSFGNIVVKNSSDVQFGNNTYYQGPVTIKQFVYNSDTDGKLALENGGKQNFGYQSDIVIETSEDCEKSFENTDQDTCSVNKEKKENSRKGADWLYYVYSKRKFYSICISSVLAILLISLIILLVNKYNNPSVSVGDIKDNNEQDSSVPIPPPSGESTLSGKLKIIPRIEWLAQPPEHPATPLHLPVPYVIILHTATENCTDQAKCTVIVRTTQTFHMESRGWWDIGYNFLVGGDGYVYEGRGWKGEGAHVYGWNSKSIGIAFIGTFNKILPPNRQMLACKQLIEKGVKEGYIAKDYKLFAHRQLSSTQSPGEALYENIKTWPHWTEKPDEGIS